MLARQPPVDAAPPLAEHARSILLVLHAGKCGLTLQSPRGLASEPGKEASAAEPQKDDSGGRRLPCLSGASATSSLLVEEALATCSLHLTFMGGALVKKMMSSAKGLLAGGLLLASTSGVLVKEPLAAGSLFLAGASGLLDEECLILIRPQIVDDRLSIPVCPHEEWAPHIPAAAIRQTGGLHGWLVDAILCHEAVDQRWWGGCSIRSSRTTTLGHVGEAAMQMSRRGSTIPHLRRRREGGVANY